ncbi:MAG: hypothetical protein EPN92_05170 [Chitinophagaceae bacterium]|nr:MAG: hypothetical protein EPN92_05170 [Chitinophagaceae bacterium]
MRINNNQLLILNSRYKKNRLYSNTVTASDKTMLFYCYVAFLLFVSLSCSRHTSVSSMLPNHKPSIVGTWRLYEDIVTDSLGNKIYLFGEHPIGYFIYEPSGHLSIHIMRIPAPSPLNFSTASIEQLRERLEAGLSYFGHYTIKDDSTVIHHVEGGTVASYIGTDQLRRYRIKGDTLQIGSPVNPCCRLIREE